MDQERINTQFELADDLYLLTDLAKHLMMNGKYAAASAVWSRVIELECAIPGLLRGDTYPYDGSTS